MLDRVVAALPEGHTWKLIVFGSAPLQLGLDQSFVSGDVDLTMEFAADFTGDVVESHLAKAQLLKEQSKQFYVEVVPRYVFNAPHDWVTRAYREQRRHVEFTFPHPVDILVAKVCRVAEKDLNAFRLVRRLTGHPTPEELIRLLRNTVDIYRPRFDEEYGGDPIANTKLVWREIYGAEIDVRAEIIRPALEERRKYFNQGEGLRDKLRAIGGG
ncbi:MAG: hypothetical protein RL514_1355 [Verrucomicrobiota bacterium]|jgi:hypothetical protein